MLRVFMLSFILLGSSTVFGITYDLTDFDLSEKDLGLINSVYGGEFGSADYQYGNYETELTTASTESTTVPDQDPDEVTREEDKETSDDDSHENEEKEDDDSDEDDHDSHEGHDHGPEDDFEITLEILGSENMNRDTFSKLLNIIFVNFKCSETAAIDCTQCSNADKFFEAVGLTEDDAVMNEEQFEKASFILGYYIVNGVHYLCNTSKTFTTVSAAKSNLFPASYICRSELQEVIGRIETAGCSQIDACYKASQLNSDSTYCISDLNEAGSTMVTMIKSISTCKCNLPKQEAFLSNVLGFMQAKDNIAPVEGFVKLLGRLGLGEVVEEDEDAVDDDDHSGHNHRRKRAIAEDLDMNVCYSGGELSSIFGVKTNVGLTKENFIDICPALIQQLYSKSCSTVNNVKEEVGNKTNELTNYTIHKKYGYATISVFLISLLAFIGLLVFPSIGTPGYKLCMQFFIALGVGSLSGDALLHIIPEILGIHKHEPGVHDHDEEVDRTYLWKLLVVVGGIYLFFLFENGIRLWNKLSKTKLSLHVHENGNDGAGYNGGRRLSHYITELPVMTSAGNTNELKPIPTPVIPPTPPSTLPKGQSLNNQNTHAHGHNHGEKKKEIVCGGLTSVALMVMIGDILHNFGDGLAIGVAFSATWMGGIGTSIAIFCHELPHEFGDFAIYINNGLSKWKALGLNFLAACFAFIGCYIGLAVANDSGARSWMMAVIAGMFLYIALVDVLHEMLEEDCGRPILQFILQNVGLLFGWTLLLLIAYFEEDLMNIANN